MLYLKRFYWWLSAFWVRYKTLIFLTAFSVITLIIITNKFNIFPRKGRKIALVGRYYLNSLPLVVTEKISYGLTKRDRENVVPGIAKYWQITNDGKRYIFHLDNLYWHDGSLVRANDLHLKIKQAKITIPNDKLLIIDLKEPFAPLPAFLTKPLFKKGLVGVGSYRLVNYRLNKDKTVKYITLEQISSLSNLTDQRLTYYFFDSYDQARTAFLMGKIDVLPNLLSDQEFKGYPNVISRSFIQKNKIVSIFLNLDNEYLKIKEFRQSLAYATPKFKKFPRVFSPISPASEYYNPQVNHFDYNLEKARDLFEKTKITSQEGKIKLDLITSPQFLSQAEQIKENWQKISPKIVVKLRVNYLPNPSFDALIKVLDAPLDPDEYFLWHSTQPTNISHLKDVKIDQLIEDGRKETNPEKRKEIYRNFQKYLVNDVPAIFLYQPITYEVVRNRNPNFNYVRQLLRL